MSDAAIRRVEIVRVLSTTDSRLSGKALGERFGVTKRTIEKDIIKLEDLGYVFDKINGPNGGYIIEKPVPELEYILFREDQSRFEEFAKLNISAENQSETAKRLMAYFKELLIKEVFS